MESETWPCCAAGPRRRAHGSAAAHRAQRRSGSRMPIARRRPDARTQAGPHRLQAVLAVRAAVRRCAAKRSARTLAVPENPARAERPQDRRSHIAWCRPTRTTAEPDPVFMIAGGPGQSATGMLSADRIAAFADARKNRHMLLVDQRGTGKLQSAQVRGRGRPQCGRRSRRCRIAGSRARVRRALPRRAVEARRPALLHHHRRDPRSRRGARATRRRRRSTWSAFPTARAWRSSTPSAIRSTRARSCSIRVAPNALVLGNEFARNLEAALDLQFARCAKTPACAQALGDPARAAATR